MRSSVLLGLGVAIFSTACAMMFDGSFGITPGGSQDIGLAREIIKNGGVPRADQFTAEGLFSQHDFATPRTEPCTELLCPRASLARVASVDGSGERMLVHLALDTNIEQLERPDLHLAAVVDISGSMFGEKLDATKLALHALVDQLGEDDRLSLVSFSDSARIEAPSTIMDASGRASLHAKISALEVEGGTNIEAGVKLGYSSLAQHRDGPGGREDRVMLLTDAQPNIGATNSESFVSLARTGAELGVGISVFGVGLDLGAELAREVSEIRGGNSFYLADADAIATIFDDEFDYIVTPVAHTLRFGVQPRAGFSFVGAYGVPDADATGEVEVSIATAFLSKRGGAMAVLLAGDLSEIQSGDALANFTLEYQTPEGEPGGAIFEAKWMGGALPIGESGSADHSGVAKLAVLLDEILALEAGAAFCEGKLDEAEAIARINQAAARLDAIATTLDDQPLRDEIALMHELASNVAADGCSITWWDPDF